MSLRRWFGALLIAGGVAAQGEVDPQLIRPDAFWRYRLGTNEPPAGWQAVDFDDSGWAAAPAGFSAGYGRFVDRATDLVETNAPYVSAFVRHAFDLADPGAVSWLALRLDHEDGMVAFLNGVEVARRGFAAGGPVAFDALAAPHLGGEAEVLDLTVHAGGLRPGRNVLAIQVHDAVRGLASPTLVVWPELRANFLRGPLMQNAASDRVTVFWDTVVPTEGRVEFGPAAGLGRVSFSTGPTNRHAVVLDGLEPDTAYEYRVRVAAGDREAASPVSGFRTLKREGGLSFALLGDSGLGSVGQYEVARVLEGMAPDLVMHVGDITYGSLTFGRVDLRCFSVYERLMRRVPFYFAVGNHDLYAGDAPFLQSFHHPTNSVTGTAHFYSFDHGDAHFAVLLQPYFYQYRLAPTNADGTLNAQYAWLTNDLATTDKPWKIVISHLPLSSSGLHRRDDTDRDGIADQLEFREVLLPVLEENGVQVAFAGHDHDYERFAPLHGVHVVVTGGGGAPLYGLDQPDPLSAMFRPVFHALQVRIEGDTLRMEAVGTNGAPLDAFVIQRRPAPPIEGVARWATPVLEDREADNGDGDLWGQTFDFDGPGLPALSGRFANLGDLFVANDATHLYLGLRSVMLPPEAHAAVFVGTARTTGVASLAGLGDGDTNAVFEGVEALDALENLRFTNFAPLIAAVVGDELADGQARLFPRPGAPEAAGQGVFRLDEGLSDVPGARLQQFNESPVRRAVGSEQNADFVEIAIPLVELGGLRPGEVIQVGAIACRWVETAEAGAPGIALDSGFHGERLEPVQGGGWALAGASFRLALDPDPSARDEDGDGLSATGEMAAGTDPLRPDTDDDGLPDGWEVGHGLDPLTGAGNDGGGGDQDGDGYTNAEEFASGTDPRDATPTLRVAARRVGAARLRLTWHAMRGRRYLVEQTDDPTMPFTPVALAGFPRTAVRTNETVEVPLAGPGAPMSWFRVAELR